MTLAQSLRIVCLTLLLGLINLAHQGNCLAQNRDAESINREAAGFYSRQQWNESISRFQDLIDQHPHSLQAQVARFYQGEAHMQLDNFNQAYADYQRYLVSSPRGEFASRARFRLGEAAYRIQDWENAVRLFSRFLKDHPQDLLGEFAWSFLGESRLERLELSDAQHAFETALDRYPSSDLATSNRMGLAMALELQGQLTDAMRLFQFLTECDDRVIVLTAHLRLGKLHFQENQFTDAEKHLEQVIDQGEGGKETIRAEAAYWLARTTYQQGRIRESLEWYKRGIALNGSLETAAALKFDGALVAKKSNQPELAMRWVDDLLQRNPSSKFADDALYLQLELLTENVPDPTIQIHEDSPGDTSIDLAKKVSSIVRQFEENYPESPWRTTSLAISGRFFYNQQQFTIARELFQKLILQDEDPRWRYFLALCLIGEEAFADAEAELYKIDITTAEESLTSLTQLAIATAKFGQQKFSAAIIGYQNYLRSIDLGDQWTTTPLNDNRLQTIEQARRELVLCWAHSGLWQDAIRGFSHLKTTSQGRDAEGSVIDLAQRLVSIAQQQELPQVADPVWDFLFQQRPDHAGQAAYLSLLAWRSVDQEDFETAQSHFERLINEFPQHSVSAAAAMWLAQWNEQHDQLDRAAQRYQWILEHFPSGKYTHVARLRYARALFERNDTAQFELAATLLQEYLETDRNGDVNEAREARDEAIFMLGWIHAEWGQTEESNHFFERLCQEFPDSKYRSDAALRLALQALESHDVSTSRQQLESIFNASGIPDPLLLKAKYLLGELATREKRWEEVDDLMEAVTAGEDSELAGRAKYWLAESAFQQAQFQQAVQRFERLVKSARQRQTEDSQSDDLFAVDSPITPWLWLRLAQSQGKLEDWTAAAATAQECLDQFPEFSLKHELLFIIAREIEDRGLLSDARQMYQAVIDADSQTGTETAAIAQWRIGEVFFHQEAFENALQAYYLVDSTYDYPRWRSAALLQAGKCQEHLRNWDQAQRLYTRLKQQFPDGEHASEADRRLEQLKRLAAVPTTQNAPAKN